MSSTFGDLQPMDTLCERWAIGAWDWKQDATTPIYRLMKQAEGAGQPGFRQPMADDILSLGKVLAPERNEESKHWKMVCNVYVRRMSPDGLAAEMKISRSNFYIRLKETLSYLTGGMKMLGFQVRNGEFRRSLDDRRLSA